MVPTTSVPLLLLLILPLTVLAGKDSGCSKEQHDRRRTCGGLVQEPPRPSTTPKPSQSPKTVPTPPPGQCYCTPMPEGSGSGEASGSGEGSGEGGNFHSHCHLIESFYNFSLILSIQEQVLWEAWIVEIENSILVNVSLTEDQKVVLISLSLKAFFSVNIDIYNALAWVEISGWGSVQDFLYVSINIQLEITQSIVTLDSNGRCDLFDALENATANGSAEEQAAVQALIEEMLAVLEDADYSYEQSLAAIFKLFKRFFKKHPHLESFVLNIDIQGYGSVQSFLQVALTYERIVTLNVVLSGSSADDCELLAGLREATQNSSLTLSVRVQINELLQKLQVYFEANVDINLRLKYVSKTCYEMFQFEPWMVSIVQQISCGEWGSIYDIIFCSGICTNYGCGNPNDGAGPKQRSTSVAPTASESSAASESSSSAAPSSSVAPSTPAGSTPKQPANCATVGDLIVVDISSNTTILTNVLISAYQSWNTSVKLGFNSCFNKIRQAIWNNVQFPTQQLKLYEIQRDFWQYNNHSVSAQKVVFDLQINVWIGTIGQFVACIH